MVTASQRRRAVDHLKSRRISERRACRLVRFSRSAAWYRLQGHNDGTLRERLKQLAQEYPRYGCPTLHDLLVTEGRVVNLKRTYRVYREEELQVRRKRREKLHIPRIPANPHPLRAKARPAAPPARMRGIQWLSDSPPSPR